ncbi:MAG: Fic family protein [Actinobacteria bacterium]|nr:MAG: Fic family protein [Actinomycetota bacterium]
MEIELAFLPKFNITTSTARNLEIIAESKGVIENAPLLPAYESRLREEARLRSVHASIRLEGNRLEEVQVEKVLKGQNVKAWKKDIQEAKNYAKVLDFIDDIYQKRDFRITEALIREINKIILKDIDDKNGGLYRQIPVAVQNTKTGQIIFQPPEFYDVPILTRELTQWLNLDKGISPIIESAIAHYELVRIHPFADGNGRSSRALAILVLYTRGYNIKRIFSVEDYADEHPDDYYGALRKSDETNTLTPFVEFFAEALANELSKVKDKVLLYSQDRKLREKIGQVYLNERQWKALATLIDKGQIERVEYEQITGASTKTAERDLKDLVEKKVVTRIGAGRKYYYKFNP